MYYAAEIINDESVDSGYWMREIEFPESPNNWDLEDFEDLIPSNDCV